MLVVHFINSSLYLLLPYSYIAASYLILFFPPPLQTINGKSLVHLLLLRFLKSCSDYIFYIQIYKYIDRFILCITVCKFFHITYIYLHLAFVILNILWTYFQPTGIVINHLWYENILIY